MSALEQELRAALTEGDLVRVFEALDALEAAEPDAVEWPYRRGCVLGDIGDDHGAVESFRRVLELDPRHLGATVNLGRHLDDLGEHAEALATYDRALALPGGVDDEVLLGNRGNTLTSLDRFEEALESYEHALAIDPEGPANRGKQTALGYLGREADCNAARVDGPFDRGPFHQLERALPNGRTLVVRFWAGRHNRPDWLREEAQEMLDTCAGFVNQPPGLVEGVRIQWAWSTLEVREHGNTLVLCEPDFATDPWERRNWDVSFTLQTVLMQNMMHTVIQVEPMPCQMQDLLAFVPDALSQPIVDMIRVQPGENGFSGWLIGPEGYFDQGPPPADAFEPMRTGDLTRMRHPLIKALSVPPGHRVRFEDHAVISVLSPDGVELWDDD